MAVVNSGFVLVDNIPNRSYHLLKRDMLFQATYDAEGPYKMPRQG